MATFDVVFEGGGAKGVALSGAVGALVARGHRLGRLVGTSAGAITATNLAIGFRPEEILASSKVRTPGGEPIYTTFDDAPSLTEEELKATRLYAAMNAVPLPLPARWEASLDTALLQGFLEVPGVASMFSLVELGGLHRGDAFLDWMRGCLEARGAGWGAFTFAQLFAATGVDLSVVTTDTTARRMRVLNHRTAPDVPVAWGVRMSMSIPFYWDEVVWRAAWGAYMGERIDGHVFVDGGVVSNFPLQLLADPDDDEVIAWMGRVEARNPVLGLYLDADLPVPGQPVPETRTHVTCRISALLDTLMSARDNAVFDTHADRIVRLPVAGYGTTEFDMADARMDALYDAGFAAADAWCAAHPNG
ncbi:MAG: patatin-like phospholipase family protein [Myxococcota bacterium]